MITREEYARSIIRNFKIEYLECNSYDTDKIVRDDELENHVNVSSSLGIALEVLGLIKDDNVRKYVATRDGGIIIDNICSKDLDTDKKERLKLAHNFQYLSVRELMYMLPSEKDGYLIKGKSRS